MTIERQTRELISRVTRNKPQDSYFLTVSLAATNADPLAVGVAKYEKNIDHRRFKIIITNSFSGGEHQVKVNGKIVDLLAPTLMAAENSDLTAVKMMAFP